MRPGDASRTAHAAAFHRAAHQVLESGAIFSDPLAVPILGEDAGEIARLAAERPSSRAMRLFIAMRSRFAEEALAAAVESGTEQLVVLGAGLDTYAYRGALRDRLRIFEVDHPATQAWKRERLAAAGIALPANLTFVPVDFERQTLAEGLSAAGFDAARQTFFTWLGCVPYLTDPAIWSTLAFIAGLPGGAQLVFDYGDPPETLDPEARLRHDRRAARVAGLGESWITYFDPQPLHARLSAVGFGAVEDLGPPKLLARYFPERAAFAPERGGHVLRAGSRPLLATADPPPAGIRP